MTKVTIITGPPGSGKTTYVKNRMFWGDLVLDQDALYSALSLLEFHEKPIGLWPFVNAAREAVITQLKADCSDDVRHVWLITCEADLPKLKKLKADLGADLVVLSVDVNECLRRIQGDPNRKGDILIWKGWIDKWWRKRMDWELDPDYKVLFVIKVGPSPPG